MTNNDTPASVHPLADRILDRIKAEHISPRSWWAFALENWVFWGLGVVAVLLGAIAFAAGLFEVENAGWQFYEATHPSFLSFFLSTAPFLWVLALVLFVAIGYANIRRTKRGYRYPLTVIALGAVLTSISLGTALYAAGIGGFVEQGIGNLPPFYQPIMVKERGWWVEPQKGLLGGTVGSTSSGVATFTLVDFAGHAWVVNGSDLSNRSRAVVVDGGVIRVVGVASTSPGYFYACFAFPWRDDSFFTREPGPPPMPGAMPAHPTSAVFATNTPPARINLCKGLGPYKELRAADEGF